MQELNLIEVDEVSGAGLWNEVGKLIYYITHSSSDNLAKTNQQLKDNEGQLYTL